LNLWTSTAAAPMEKSKDRTVSLGAFCAIPVVTDYLVLYCRISPGHLSPIGYGKSWLLYPSRPNDGVNRRVQITNTGVQQ